MDLFFWFFYRFFYRFKLFFFFFFDFDIRAWAGCIDINCFFFWLA